MDTTRPIMVHQYLFRFLLSSVRSLVATQGRGLFAVIRDRGTGQTTLRMEVDYLYAEVYGYGNIPGGTGCIISFSGREDENENVIEITNSIDIFTALDIVIVVQTFLPCFVQKRFKDIPTVFTISVYIFVWETLTFLGISRATSSVKESINFLLYYYFTKKVELNVSLSTQLFSLTDIFRKC